MGAYLTLHKYDNKYIGINQIKNEGSPLLALLNSKRLEISPKNGWRALPPNGRINSEGELNFAFSNWRRGRDSNSRYPYGYSGFQDRPI